MTLVDATTGEVLADISADDARVLTEKIKVGVEAVWHLVVEAYDRGAHRALGYANWDDYCTREFGTSRIRLPREERRDVVASLRDAGLSERAISAATGVGRTTIQRDLGGGPNGPPEVSPRFKESTVKVVGRDGKRYPSTTDRIAAAKAANPVSGSGKTRAEVAAKVEKAKEMAAAGSTSKQIAAAIGIAPESMSDFRKRHAFDVPADAVVGKGRRIDPDRIVEETAIALEGLVMSLDLLTEEDRSSLDSERAKDWATSFTSSLRSLNRFHKHLKEMALVHEL